MTVDAGMSLDGKRILVTGGSGFIGTNLVDSLATKTDLLLNLDAASPRCAAHYRYWRECDIRQEARVSRTVGLFRPDVLVHLAARTDLHGRTIGDYATNTKGLMNVIQAATEVGTVETAMFASSRLVFDISHRPAHAYDYRPSTAYGQSKAEGERIVRASATDMNWILVRPTSIWGPWFGVPYRTFFDAVLSGRYLHPGRRRVLKSYGFVGNTVFEIQRLLEGSRAEVARKVFWLADYPPIELREWADTITRVAGAKPVKSVPFPVLRAAAMAGDFARWLGFREPPLTTFRLQNLVTEMIYDTSDLERTVGVLPIPLKDATSMTVEWMRRS
jgi:nucleoside-diphosphate-sugar epimerase